jgi:hypothetical protein
MEQFLTDVLPVLKTDAYPKNLNYNCDIVANN